MLHLRHNRLHLAIASLVLLLSGCLNTNDLSVPTCVSTRNVPQSTFTQIVLGETTEDTVVKIYGEPTQRGTQEVYTFLWYDIPGGWIAFRDGKVVEISEFIGNSSIRLESILARYGSPDKVALYILEGPQRRSTTFLLYPCQNLSFEIPGEIHTFTPDLPIIDGTRVAIGYFGEYIHREGLDGSSKLGKIEVMNWPGLIRETPTP